MKYHVSVELCWGRGTGCTGRKCCWGKTTWRPHQAKDSEQGDKASLHQQFSPLQQSHNVCGQMAKDKWAKQHEPKLHWRKLNDLNVSQPVQVLNGLVRPGYLKNWLFQHHLSGALCSAEEVLCVPPVDDIQLVGTREDSLVGGHPPPMELPASGDSPYSITTSFQMQCKDWAVWVSFSLLLCHHLQCSYNVYHLTIALEINLRILVGVLKNGLLFYLFVCLFLSLLYIMPSLSHPKIAQMQLTKTIK